jgi:hypothetical protein
MASLIFWVGPTLQNPEKTAGKFEFRKNLGKPVLQNPEKTAGKNRFSRIFWVPKKLRVTAGRSKF